MGRVARPPLKSLETAMRRFMAGGGEFFEARRGFTRRFLDRPFRNEQCEFMTKAKPDSAEGAAPRKTRIQERRQKLLLDCALDVFATYGFHGSTIDQIANKADLSKPNVLYYFKSKELIYQALLQRTLEGWLDPFIAMNAKGDPMGELEKYVDAKMDMSFDSPLPSRLFATEVIGGAPQMIDGMRTTLRAIVDEKAAIIQGWMDEGRLKPVDPHHLIFAIWSVTQHYADFAIQIECLLGASPNRKQAKEAVKDILLRGLKP
jgi:TetR/AcrR family transcriptional regulator